MQSLQRYTLLIVQKYRLFLEKNQSMRLLIIHKYQLLGGKNQAMRLKLSRAPSAVLIKVLSVRDIIVFVSQSFNA